MKCVFPITNYSGKTLKPLLSDKVVAKDEMQRNWYNENNERDKTHLRSAEILNTFFIVILNLEISTYERKHDQVIDNGKDPTLKLV